MTSTLNVRTVVATIASALVGVAAYAMVVSEGSGASALTAMVFAIPIALPAAIVVGLPLYLLICRLGAVVWIAAPVAGAAAAFLGTMASVGFGLLDPSVLHGRAWEAIRNAAALSMLPTLSGAIGGVAGAVLLRKQP